MTMKTHQDVLMVMLKFAKKTPIINLQDIACLVCVSKSIFDEIDIGQYTTDPCVIHCTVDALHLQAKNVHTLCIDLPLFLTDVCKVQRYYGKINYKKHIVKALDDFATHDIYKLSNDNKCDAVAVLTSICEMIQISQTLETPIDVMLLFLLAHCTRKFLKKVNTEQGTRQRNTCRLRKVASRLCIVLNNASFLREAITHFPYVFIERTLRSCNETRRALCNL